MTSKVLIIITSWNPMSGDSGTLSTQVIDCLNAEHGRAIAARIDAALSDRSDVRALVIPLPSDGGDRS